MRVEPLLLPCFATCRHSMTSKMRSWSCWLPSITKSVCPPTFYLLQRVQLAKWLVDNKVLKVDASVAEVQRVIERNLASRKVGSAAHCCTPSCSVAVSHTAHDGWWSVWYLHHVRLLPVAPSLYPPHLPLPARSPCIACGACCLLQSWGVTLETQGSIQRATESVLGQRGGAIASSVPVGTSAAAGTSTGAAAAAGTPTAATAAPSMIWFGDATSVLRAFDEEQQREHDRFIVGEWLCGRDVCGCVLWQSESNQLRLVAASGPEHFP